MTVMEHGRDHDEREQKHGRARHDHAQPESDDEALEAPERDAALRRGGHGSEPAPTPRAAEREAERHRRERELGHVAAGTEGERKAAGDVDRGELDAAARTADQAARRITD